MENKSQNYRDVFEKSNILNNKTNSSNMSSAKKNDKLSDIAGKIKGWQDGIRSESGFERLRTMAEIATAATGTGK